MLDICCFARIWVIDYQRSFKTFVARVVLIVLFCDEIYTKSVKRFQKSTSKLQFMLNLVCAQHNSCSQRFIISCSSLIEPMLYFIHTPRNHKAARSVLSLRTKLILIYTALAHCLEHRKDSASSHWSYMSRTIAYLSYYWSDQVLLTDLAILSVTTFM